MLCDHEISVKALCREMLHGDVEILMKTLRFSIGKIKMLLWRFYQKYEDLFGDMKSSYRDVETSLKTWRNTIVFIKKFKRFSHANRDTISKDYLILGNALYGYFPICPGYISFFIKLFEITLRDQTFDLVFQGITFLSIMIVVVVKEIKFAKVPYVGDILYKRLISYKLFSLDSNQYLNMYGDQRCGHKLIKCQLIMNGSLNILF